MARWKCDDCGQMHRKNPSKCKSCGHTILVRDRTEQDRDYRKVALAGLAAVVLLAVVVALL